MKNIRSIFKNDLKKIGTNLVAFIVMIGICILPALYAWFNIASNWDPYGNAKNIKIAVVNLDEGAEFGNMKIDIGSQVVENLKTNNQLGWQFVSKAEAEEGVKVGTYYASVTIPKDFSANMTSILSGELKRPQIIYTLNEKLNAIAPKITDKGAEAIKNSVNQSFIDTITTTLVETLTTTAGTADSGYLKIKNNLNDNVQDIIDNIEAVQTSIDLVITTIDASNVLLDNAKDGLPNVQDLLVGAGTLSSDTKNTINGAGTAASQITAGADGVITAIDSLYSQISPDIDSAFASINDDSNKAANKFTEITKVNNKVISLESELVTFFTMIGKHFDLDTSEIVTDLNNNIAEQNNLIKKMNDISDTLKKTGKLPENAKSDIEGLVDTANRGIAGISNEFSANVKPTVDTMLDDVFTELDGITGAMNDIDGTVPDIENALDSGKESL
ncbi:MAG: YhgE/Pip family protein, partial [Clostridia bacterium]|nr:YhgE/Pip family protein [Clostridia bacterium]